MLDTLTQLRLRHHAKTSPSEHLDQRRDPHAERSEKKRENLTFGDLFEDWIRTAGAILKPGGQLSLIARPESVASIITACGKNITPA